MNSHDDKLSNEVQVDYSIPVYQVELVRERNLEVPAVSSPSEAAAVLTQFLSRADREHFVVVLVATNGQLIGIHTAHVGSLSYCVVAAREVFKVAILANAASIVVGHNHPSGNLEPSRQDVTVSQRLVKAGKVMGIPVLDSLVIGHNGDFTSLQEAGLLY